MPVQDPDVAREAISWVHYLPLVTTLVAVPFVVSLVRRHRARRSGPHLAWWAAGVACYGAGTAFESAITLVGNGPALNKAWYVAGALLGAYPLAQGTVYLLLSRERANLLSWITLPLLAALVVLVLLSPIDESALEAHRPGGQAIAWTWVRYLTPLLNVYAAGFLVGGAIVSARRFSKDRALSHLALGNALIAAGALLPAIGGSIAKTGRVEALYVAELVGLLLIWAGYRSCVRQPPVGPSR